MAGFAQRPVEARSKPAQPPKELRGAALRPGELPGQTSPRLRFFGCGSQRNWASGDHLSRAREEFEFGARAVARQGIEAAGGAQKGAAGGELRQ